MHAEYAGKSDTKRIIIEYGSRLLQSSTTWIMVPEANEDDLFPRSPLGRLPSLRSAALHASR